MLVTITLVQVDSKPRTSSVFSRERYVSSCDFLIDAWFRNQFLNGQKRKSVGVVVVVVVLYESLA